ncbi:MAG: polymer-forming cytoskeletal protein [Candidatus Methylacidiphilales bacterium]
MALLEKVQSFFATVGRSEKILLRGSMVLKGDAFFTSRGLVDGPMEGTLTGADRIELGKNAEVKGSCKAPELVVLGRISGRLEAEQAVILKAGSIVRAEIRARSLDIAPESEFEGSLEIGFN